MTSRDRNVLAILAFVAVLGGFWFLALSPRRQEARKLDQQVVQARQERDAAIQAAASSKSSKLQYARDYATVARLGKAIPSDDDTASLVFQVENAAGLSRANFRMIKLGGGSAPAGNAAPSSPTAAAAAPLPPGAIIGPAGLSKLPLTFQFEGNFFELEHILRRLHAFTQVHGGVIRVQGRLLTIDGIAMSEAEDGFPHVKATVMTAAYLAPRTTLPGAAAAPSAAAPGSTPAPSGSAAATPPAAAAAIGVGR
jgi:hypothetical protein